MECDIDALLAAPTHSERLKIATRGRPWPDVMVERMRRERSQSGADERETDILARVMRDEAPELTRPGGIDDDRRWWIDTDEPWDWTLWRSDDGLAVLEVLRSGWSFTTASAVLDTAQLAAFTRDGIAALDDLLVKLRHG